VSYHVLYSHIVKGLGRGEQQQPPSLGEEGAFAVHAGVYGKVQAEPDGTSNGQERRMGRKRCLSLARAGLLSYLCMLCTMCASLSRLGGVSTPPQHEIAPSDAKSKSTLFNFVNIVATYTELRYFKAERSVRRLGLAIGIQR
jgi:hypothetical protein